MNDIRNILSVVAIVIITYKVAKFAYKEGQKKGEEKSERTNRYY